MYLRFAACDVTALQGIFDCWIFFQSIFNFASGINDKHIIENDTGCKRIPTIDENDGSSDLTHSLKNSYSDLFCVLYQMFLQSLPLCLSEFPLQIMCLISKYLKCRMYLVCYF